MDYVRVYGRAGIEGGVLGEGSAALSLNPHPRLRREFGTRKFNGVRSDGVEGCATRLAPNNSKAFVWVKWKGLPPASHRQSKGIHLSEMRCASRPS